MSTRFFHAIRTWIHPQPATTVPVVRDRRQRKMLIVELVIVFSITLGLSGLRSLLSLADSLLRPEPLNQQSVAINASQATSDVIDLLKQLVGVLQLAGWGALGLYLLWRGGFKPASIGLARAVTARDWRWSLGLTALIGIPGLVLYLIGYHLGFNLAVQPSTLDDTWWRPIALILSAAGNSWAEEILVVGYLLTRLRQLGSSENSSLVIAALLRGSYHLYQGIGGFIGNLLMGLVFGRVWQRTNRLWPLVLAHTFLDVVAFVGYAFLRGHFTWLP